MKLKTLLLNLNVLLATTLLTVAAPMPAKAADTTNSTKVVAPAKNASRTVGLDIVNKTVNPDKSTSLTFRWKEKGNTSERTVVANDQTIVVYNGQIKKFSDLTDDQFHA